MQITPTFVLLVGKDDAAPKARTISFASTMARALMGKSVGDVFEVNEQGLEVIAIA